MTGQKQQKLDVEALKKWFKKHGPIEYEEGLLRLSIGRINPFVHFLLEKTYGYENKRSTQLESFDTFQAVAIAEKYFKERIMRLTNRWINHCWTKEKGHSIYCVVDDREHKVRWYETELTALIAVCEELFLE